MTTALAEPVVYPREAVVTIKQVAAALGVSPRHVERMDLPTVYLGSRTRRYVWAQILDTLEARAK